jgi:hypothetical protein
MKNISKEDYIIWNTKEKQPVEELYYVYHYTTVIDIANDRFNLKENDIWMCVAELPVHWQKKISEAIEKTK